MRDVRAAVVAAAIREAFGSYDIGYSQGFESSSPTPCLVVAVCSVLVRASVLSSSHLSLSLSLSLPDCPFGSAVGIEEKLDIVRQLNLVLPS